jgi:hypothetical protein
MTAFDAAWAVLKGENIHPSVRLHAEMGAKNLDMYPPKTKKINGELEPRSDYTRRRMDYESRRSEAQERAKDDQRVPTTTFRRPVVERMPRDDDIADLMNRYARAYNQYSYHSNTPDHKYERMAGATRESLINYHGNRIQEIEDEYAAQGGNPEDFNHLAFEIARKHRGL